MRLLPRRYYTYTGTEKEYCWFDFCRATCDYLPCRLGCPCGNETLSVKAPPPDILQVPGGGGGATGPYLYIERAMFWGPPEANMYIENQVRPIVYAQADLHVSCWKGGDACGQNRIYMCSVGVQTACAKSLGVSRRSYCGIRSVVGQK